MEEPGKQAELERFLATWMDRWDRTQNAYDSAKGTRSQIIASLEKDFSMFDWAIRKGDPECGGVPEFLGMTQNGTRSCGYRWGVNRFTHTFYRFGEDTYLHVKERADSYYTRH